MSFWATWRVLTKLRTDAYMKNRRLKLARKRAISRVKGGKREENN